MVGGLEETDETDETVQPRVLGAGVWVTVLDVRAGACAWGSKLEARSALDSYLPQ